MIDGRALTEEQANAIWDVLVKHAGASADEWDRHDFVSAAMDGTMTEWRFQGRLGFGGKFYLERRRWRVGAYPEDMTPERQRMVGEANGALAGLRASYEALAAALAEPGQETMTP